MAKSQGLDDRLYHLYMRDDLGVQLAEVKAHYIQQKICHIPMNELEGFAIDSVFKALCSEGKLLSGDNRQVLAPFGFVSVLAGAYLAIEACRRTIPGPVAGDFNYWRLSPRSAPVVDLKQTRGRQESCEFCGQASLVKVSRELWDVPDAKMSR